MSFHSENFPENSPLFCSLSCCFSIIFFRTNFLLNNLLTHHSFSPYHVQFVGRDLIFLIIICSSFCIDVSSSHQTLSKLSSIVVSLFITPSSFHGESISVIEEKNYSQTYFVLNCFHFIQQFSISSIHNVYFLKNVI